MSIRTGERAWHFQNIHHDLWDYNLPPAPGLFDIVMGGERIPALAQVGKSGFMFILNRETGEPVHGVEERPVPGWPRPLMTRGKFPASPARPAGRKVRHWTRSTHPD